MNKKEKNEKRKIAKEVSKELQRFNDLEVTEEMLKNNKIEFKYKKEKYRVRKPNFGEKEDIRKARSKKYVELLSNDDYLLRKQLIKKLKNKGIDIDVMERKVTELQAEIDNIREKLAPIEDKKIQEKLKDNIRTLLEEQQEINVDVVDYLEPCVENELEEFGNIYTICKVLEKQENKKWKKVFKKYEDILDLEDDGLITTAAYYISLILFRRNFGDTE